VTREGLVLALAGAALCGCKAKPVADVALNGLVEVNVVGEPIVTVIDGNYGRSAGISSPLVVEVRNGAPVPLRRASVKCVKNNQSFNATLAGPLDSGSRIKLVVALAPTQDPKKLTPTSSSVCGFLSAELDGTGRFVSADGQPRPAIPTPEFHP
jgi:hypothetical protein